MAVSNILFLSPTLCVVLSNCLFLALCGKLSLSHCLYKCMRRTNSLYLWKPFFSTRLVWLGMAIYDFVDFVFWLLFQIQLHGICNYVITVWNSNNINQSFLCLWIERPGAYFFMSIRLFEHLSAISFARNATQRTVSIFGRYCNVVSIFLGSSTLSHCTRMTSTTLSHWPWSGAPRMTPFWK